MIYILYSADYEVFFAKNFYSEYNILIEPTNRLLDLCLENAIPITLFCDVCCLWRYQELGLNMFPDAVEEQLMDSVQQGHDVQTHLHPHWLFTEITNDGCIFDPNTFLLGHLSNKPEECVSIVTDLLSRSKVYFENIIQPISPSYRCIAFRAGGYGIQPKMDVIFHALEKSGYKIDSSIIPNYVFHSTVNKIDFRMMPTISNYYIREREGSIDYSTRSKGIFEIPVAAARTHVIERIPLFLIRSLMDCIENEKSPVRGMPIQSLLNSNIKGKKVIEKLLFPRVDAVDIETDPFSMFYITKKYLNNFSWNEEDVFFSVNCHPKNMGKRSFKALEKYHNLLIEKYGQNLQPITFQEAAELI